MSKYKGRGVRPVRHGSACQSEGTTEAQSQVGRPPEALSHPPTCHHTPWGFPHEVMHDPRHIGYVFGAPLVPCPTCSLTPQWSPQCGPPLYHAQRPQPQAAAPPARGAAPVQPGSACQSEGTTEAQSQVGRPPEALSHPPTCHHTPWGFPHEVMHDPRRVVYFFGAFLVPCPTCSLMPQWSPQCGPPLYHAQRPQPQAAAPPARGAAPVQPGSACQSEGTTEAQSQVGRPPEALSHPPTCHHTPWGFPHEVMHDPRHIGYVFGAPLVPCPTCSLTPQWSPQCGPPLYHAQRPQPQAAAPPARGAAPVQPGSACQSEGTTEAQSQVGRPPEALSHPPTCHHTPWGFPHEVMHDPRRVVYFFGAFLVPCPTCSLMPQWSPQCGPPLYHAQRPQPQAAAPPARGAAPVQPGSACQSEGTTEAQSQVGRPPEALSHPPTCHHTPWGFPHEGPCCVSVSTDKLSLSSDPCTPPPGQD
ncbi:uncharacterized protein [Vicugna pacos]|uniref:Uncharacterized protein n=1 Tax=Vicugna pacos TaxID=30538 RepID=A0ABM5CH10_VICPA